MDANMSAAYFYQLIGHVYTAAYTADHEAEVASALKGAGFGADMIKRGLELSEKAEELLERKTLESPDNKTLEHNIHGAVGEVEMWLQTVALKMRKAGFDKEAIHAAVDHHLHSSHHTITAVAQALRALGVLRTLEEDDIEKLGGEQRARDLVIRGNTLVKKLYKVADDFVSPGSMVGADDPLVRELDALMDDLSRWIEKLAEANEKLVSIPKAAGMTGLVPDTGFGLPSGGTAFGVVLHEKAQQASPNPREATLNSGWSVGRQGNNENVGKGWLSTQYGTAMND